jgi:hypothetical protein
MCRGLRGVWNRARCYIRISDLIGGSRECAGRIPGMCENDVVARVVLATATGRGRTGEAEFEDHVGVYVGVIRARYLFIMGNDQSAMAISKSLATPTICGTEVQVMCFSVFRVRVGKL